jgi:putative RecB family exonuclease
MAYTKKASASQINLYKACPRKYYFKYIERIKEPQSIALIKGSLVHACIQKFYDLNPKKSNINLQNYKTEFYNYMDDVFERVLKSEKVVFGKTQRSYLEDMNELFDGNEIKIAREIVDVQNILKNYITVFLWQFEQYTESKTIFSQIWYMVKPKFSELELSTQDFLGFVDECIEKDGKLIITDYKTTKHYKLGYSEEYEIQLKLYCYFYYLLNGVVPDYGCIYFVRTGNQCLFPINKETLIPECKKILEDFFFCTKSTDITDYPMNPKYQFCTCILSKNASKDWCFYQSMCDWDIENSNVVPYD